MRNALLLLFLVTVSWSSLGQETTVPAPEATPASEPEILVNKRGKPILPEKGDFSLGLSATPFFQYLGNMFNNSVNNPAPVVQSPLFPSLVVKYMKNANTAIRARVTLNNISTDGKNLVDNSASPDPALFVTDTKTYTSTDVMLGMGIEKRRGKGRLQGIYGVEGFFGFLSTSSTYSYGNAITPTNPNVTFTIWAPNSVAVVSTTNGSNRILETSSGTSITFGVKGFLGAEYFIAPKVSLGGELGYSLSLLSAGSGTQRTEAYNFGTGITTTTTVDFFPTPSTFSFGTVPVGSIFLNLYL